MHKLDVGILTCLRRVAGRPPLRRAVRAYTVLGAYGSGWTVAGLAGSALDPERRSAWLRAAVAPQVALLANSIVKQLVRRDRPALKRLPPLGRPPATLSFPSAHATTSFAGAAALARVMPGARVPLFGAAAAMALTRPALGYHYPSDSLAGAILGLAVERLVPCRLGSQRGGKSGGPGGTS